MTDRQCKRCGEVNPADIHTCTPKEQEPVAWITTWNEPNDAGVELHWVKQERGSSSKHTPLYTAPPKKDEPVIDKSMAKRIATQLGWEPKKEWVGLTDEDLDFWGGELGLGELGKGVLRAVDAHLKGKNT